MKKFLCAHPSTYQSFSVIELALRLLNVQFASGCTVRLQSSMAATLQILQKLIVFRVHFLYKTVRANPTCHKKTSKPKAIRQSSQYFPPKPIQSHFVCYPPPSRKSLIALLIATLDIFACATIKQNKQIHEVMRSMEIFIPIKVIFR